MTKMCIAAANYIIEKTNEFNQGKGYLERISMTCKRLQKLLYFSEVEYMKENGAPMITDDFYAWPSGPVIPSVYHKFVRFQSGDMKPINDEHTPITNKIIKAIDSVLKKTNSIDTLDLVEFSHVKYGPWYEVYDAKDTEHNQVITKESIISFYKNHDIFGNEDKENK